MALGKGGLNLISAADLLTKEPGSPPPSDIPTQDHLLHQKWSPTPRFSAIHAPSPAHSPSPALKALNPSGCFQQSGTSLAYLAFPLATSQKIM